MKKIYVVTAGGEQSDYKIYGVFDTIELAENFISLNEFPLNDDRIEEYELNPNNSDLTYKK